MTKRRKSKRASTRQLMRAALPPDICDVMEQLAKVRRGLRLERHGEDHDEGRNDSDHDLDGAASRRVLRPAAGARRKPVSNGGSATAAIGLSHARRIARGAAAMQAALFAVLLLAHSALAQSNTGIGVSVQPAPTAIMGVESRTDGGETRVFERFVNEPSKVNPIANYRNAIGTPGTPVPAIPATNTPIGTSPTPTALPTARFCSCKAAAANNDVVYVGGPKVSATPAGCIGGAGTLNSTCGIELSPGQTVTLPTKSTNDGSEIWVTSPTANSPGNALSCACD